MKSLELDHSRIFRQLHLIREFNDRSGSEECICLSISLEQSIHFHMQWVRCPGEILGIIGRDPSVSKSNQLHVDIFFVLYLY